MGTKKLLEKITFSVEYHCNERIRVGSVGGFFHAYNMNSGEIRITRSSQQTIILFQILKSCCKFYLRINL